MITVEHTTLARVVKSISNKIFEYYSTRSQKIIKMGNNNSKSPSVGMESFMTETQKPAEKPKCKACCACPETKQVRDACIIEKGQENCTKLIEAHKECMRKMGFNI